MIARYWHALHTPHYLLTPLDRFTLECGNVLLVLLVLGACWLAFYGWFWATDPSRRRRKARVRERKGRTKT